MERFPHPYKEYPYKECFVLLPNRCGISQSSPFRASVIAGTCSLFQSMWDPPIHPPSGPRVLGGTPSRVHPLRGSASLLAHCPVSSSIPFVTAQAHREQILSFLGFPFRASPQGFQNAFTMERFPLPYKECFVLLPNRSRFVQKRYFLF